MAKQAGIDAYWEFQRKQAEILEESNIVFPNGLEKRKYIDKLWKNAKVQKKENDDDKKKLAKVINKSKELLKAHTERLRAQSELAKAEEELEKARAAANEAFKKTGKN